VENFLHAGACDEPVSPVGWTGADSSLCPGVVCREGPSAEGGRLPRSPIRRGAAGLRIARYFDEVELAAAPFEGEERSALQERIAKAL